MNTVTEGIRDAEFLESEQPNRLSRDQVTLTQDAEVYESGTVLKEAADKMVRFDGTGDAAGVLMLEVDATTADADGTAIVRLAAVTEARLVYPEAVTAPQKVAAVAKLAESFVIAR